MESGEGEVAGVARYPAPVRIFEYLATFLHWTLEPESDQAAGLCVREQRPRNRHKTEGSGNHTGETVAAARKGVRVR